MKSVTRVVSTLATASLALVGLGTASQAGTGTVTDSGVTVTATAKDVVLKSVGYRTPVTVYLRFKSSFEADGAPTVVLENIGGNGYEIVDAVQQSATLWKATAYVDADEYGSWSVEAYGLGSVYDDYEFYDAYDITTFRTKLKSSTRVNATPEPVQKGAYATVSGDVRYYNPDYNYGDGAWRPLSGATVKLYFDPAGTAAPKYVATVTTTSKGTYVKKAVQSTSGTWIAKFAGGTKVALSQGTDYVTAK